MAFGLLCPVQCPLSAYLRVANEAERGKPLGHRVYTGRYSIHSDIWLTPLVILLCITSVLFSNTRGHCNMVNVTNVSSANVRCSSVRDRCCLRRHYKTPIQNEAHTIIGSSSSKLNFRKFAVNAEVLDDQSGDVPQKGNACRVNLTKCGSHPLNIAIVAVVCGSVSTSGGHHY